MIHIDALTGQASMSAKRMMLLSSPCQEVDLGRNINILVLPEPLRWEDELGIHEMDGCAICNYGFLSEFKHKVQELYDKEITGMFQFRGAVPGKVLAKGTIREPIEGLTTFHEFQGMVENQFGTGKFFIEKYDIIMDKNTLKVFPWDDIKEPTVVQFPSNFIGFHRADDHSSNRSISGVQLARFGKLETTRKEQKLINAVLNGDREAMKEFLHLSENVDEEGNVDPLRSRLERTIAHGLPLTENIVNQLETNFMSKFVKNNLINKVHRSGSRFLISDPKVPYGSAVVPEKYLPPLKKGRGYFWISTPTVSEECCVEIKKENIKTSSTINAIVLHPKMILDGYRDEDGDLSKIIDLPRS